MVLKGGKVELRPTSLEEIPLFFTFATQSQSTPYWYGELYGDKIPTNDEFIKDWKSYYFDGTEPELGRSFLIIFENIPIGQINYNEINRKDSSVELDIIIADDCNKGKGFGSDAIKTLVKYLFEEMKVDKCFIDVINENKRAMKAYRKAGFIEESKFEKKGKVWHRMVIIK